MASAPAPTLESVLPNYTSDIESIGPNLGLGEDFNTWLAKNPDITPTSNYVAPTRENAVWQTLGGTPDAMTRFNVIRGLLGEQGETGAALNPTTWSGIDSAKNKYKADEYNAAQTNIGKELATYNPAVKTIQGKINDLETQMDPEQAEVIDCKI